MARYYNVSDEKDFWDQGGSSGWGSVFTACIWFRMTNLTLDKPIFSVSTGFPNEYGMGLFHHKASGSNFIQADMEGASAASSISDGSTAISTATWHHGTVRRNSASSHDMRIGGGGTTHNVNSGTNIGTISNVRFFNAGMRLDKSLHIGDGDLAEFGFWNVALSNDEISALQLGVSPLMIRPASLKFYHPLLRIMGDSYVGGFPWTATGVPSKSPHPPGIIYPSDLPAGVIDIGDRTLYEWTAQDMNPGVVAATMDTRNNHRTVEFDDTIEEYVELTGVMPRKADLDYLGLKLVWTAGSTAGQVVWRAGVQRIEDKG